MVKGATKQSARETLQELWGKLVLAEGVLTFGSGGTPQHLDVDFIGAATERDQELFGELPTARTDLPIPIHKLKDASESGADSIVGSWPGDETDEEFEEMLRELREIRRGA